MTFNWKDPDYPAVYAERAWRLKNLHKRPDLVHASRVHYATNPWDFVNDWGMTFDPRNIAIDRPASMPFVLWPRQREYLEWLYGQYRNRERGLVEKTRDAGVTWLSVGFAVSMWLFVPGFLAGFGSRKEELVDKSGDDKSIFHKARFFLRHVPTVFMPPSFNWRTCSSHMRINNPDTDAALIGEAGDQIGRGGRTSMYVVDEAAYIEHQEDVDAALSQNTNCQIDISTYQGSGNAFYKKSMQFDKTRRKFVFDWRDDPRKDDAWLEKQKEEQSEATVAQEILRDPNASVEGVFIPSKYVEAAIDAHIRLKFAATGMRRVGFDIADVSDARAVVGMHGVVVKLAKQKKQGDVTQAVPWAFELADEFRADALGFDADGMGGPVMKMSGKADGLLRMAVIPYFGSGGVRDPNHSKGGIEKQRKAMKSGKASVKEGTEKALVDVYENFRAQSWTETLLAFQNTYRVIDALNKGQIIPFNPDDLISIDSASIEPNELIQLKAELSRPMRVYAKSGKIMVEPKFKMAERGVDSPNMADALVIARSIDARAVMDHQNKKKNTGVRDLEYRSPIR